MTPALTPELAVAYLRELSADVRGGVVLGADGERLAGDPELAVPGAAVLAAMGAARSGEAILAGGAVLAARGDGMAVIVVCGPHAIPALARLDLAGVLVDVGAQPRCEERAGGGATAPAALPAGVAEALISAAPRGPGE